MQPFDELDSWVRPYLSPSRPPLVPEIETLAARGLIPLWEAMERVEGGPCEPPYWAFSWPGSQALARYLLDHPTEVRDRAVLDLGAGNGLASVACAIAGAARVVANDVDERAVRMAATTARRNGVAIEVETVDRLEVPVGDASIQIVIVGDLFYSRRLAKRAVRFLQVQSDAGSTALIGEPGRDYAIRSNVDVVASYRVPVERELESRDWIETRVCRMRQGNSGSRV